MGIGNSFSDLVLKSSSKKLFVVTASYFRYVSLSLSDIIYEQPLYTAIFVLVGFAVIVFLVVAFIVVVVVFIVAVFVHGYKKSC